jgi:hypothetical protein
MFFLYAIKSGFNGARRGLLLETRETDDSVVGNTDPSAAGIMVEVAIGSGVIFAGGDEFIFGGMMREGVIPDAYTGAMRKLKQIAEMSIDLASPVNNCMILY